MPDEHCMRGVMLILATVVLIHAQFGNADDRYDIEEERRYPTPFANSSLLPSLLWSLSQQKHTPKTRSFIKESYDFVVVGAGAGGSVVSARLSELSCVSVLVLEAGKSAPQLTDVPAAWLSFLGTDIDWNYTTASQKYAAFGLVDQKLPWASGRAVGGGTVINTLLDVRGNQEDYDIWAQMGADGWSYSDVLPYFKKTEQNKDYGETYFHGAFGPITMEKLRFNSRLKQAISQAASELGYSFVDYNAEDQLGFSIIQATLRNAQRCSAAKGYLVPAEDRPNLDIVPNVLVTKVIVQNGAAIGVEFDYLGEHHKVLANREVIVSAGAVKSAQLLMLSGIGPKEHLLEMGIPNIVDLPVGQNFFDHVCTYQHFEVNEDVPVYDLSDPGYINEYIQQRTGPLSSPDIANVAFLRNDNYAGPGRRPNHEIYFNDMTSEGFYIPANLKPEVEEYVYGPYINRKNFSCAVQVAHPRSRGYVKLRSLDPYDEPIINPQYLMDPEDVQDIVEGIKVCKAIANTESMQRIGATPFKNLPPECEALKEDEDAGLACLTRSIIASLHHPAGTARMGRVDDPNTVVDSELRVKGIENLRVIDASVFPNPTSGNTNVPTLMVAEKASDMIKRYINCG